MLVGARKVLATVGLDVPAETRLGTLRTSEQQLVEIARALSLDARVLIMDEPTAALSQREVERLFTVVADLRLHGVAMMFVGHRMDEIFRIADRIAVLRDGRLIGVKPKAELGRAAAISMMVGREVTDLYPERRHAIGALVLEAQGPFARRRLFEYRPQAPRRRGARAWRPGRQRSDRDRARAVRHRPAGRRRNPDRWQAGQLRIGARRHGCAHRLCLGRPHGPEPGDGFLHPRQCGAACPRQGRPGRPLRHGSRDRSGLGLVEAHEAALFRVRAAGQGTVRRQPAEGGRWPNGCAPSRASSSSTSRRKASMSAPRRKCTR